MPKSNTDLHWNARALSERDDTKVNIGDTVQRDLELDFVFAHLPAAGGVLEVGCGNGYVTQQVRSQVKHVDAFDFAENMVERARATYGETNNRFFHGSVLDRATCEAQAYDAAVCVRVLINLRGLDEQAAGLDNIAHWLKPGGRLILIEGFRDGFDELNRLRADCGMPALVPAAINYYSYVTQLRPTMDRWFELRRGISHRHVRFSNPCHLSSPRRARAGRWGTGVSPKHRARRPLFQPGRNAAPGARARLRARAAGIIRTGLATAPLFPTQHQAKTHPRRLFDGLDLFSTTLEYLSAFHRYPAGFYNSLQPAITARTLALRAGKVED